MTNFEKMMSAVTPESIAEYVKIRLEEYDDCVAAQCPIWLAGEDLDTCGHGWSWCYDALLQWLYSETDDSREVEE